MNIEIFKMIKKLIVFVICFMPLAQNAQDFSALWKGHFSYYNTSKVIQAANKVYAVADNAIFSIDLISNEIKELTTINGLSGNTISTIYYSETYQLLVIGYESGLIEIAFDNNDEILTVLDVLNRPTIPGTQKRINHFYPSGNLVYIATNYGISVYNLDRLEFGDTYFIGNNGTQIQVNQTTIFGDYIYAACFGGNGIRKAAVSSPNLIDFRNWQTVATGDFVAIESVSDKLYTVNTNRQLFDVSNDMLNNALFQYNTVPTEVKNVNNNLVVTTSNNVFVYNSNLALTSKVDMGADFPTSYKSATIDANYAYIATTTFGVLKTPLATPTTFEEIRPAGPFLNNAFSLEADANGTWVTFGEYSQFFNPYTNGGPQRRGFSRLKNDLWIQTPFSEVFGAGNLNTITPNPLKPNQVFISSFFSGLLEVNNDIPTKLYNQTNSGLELNAISSADLRLGASAFDAEGLLWTVSSLVNKPLKSYNPANNQWNSYSLNSIDDLANYSDLIIGNDGTIWVGSQGAGLIGFKKNGTNPIVKNINSEADNFPTSYVKSLALDKNNQLWIGTFVGLRVLYNPSNFFDDDDAKVDEIIILEDGVAKELLFQQFIRDIEVDGSNNKWIGTADSGVFYLSQDGQKTIFHFTTDNSPLPTNLINDISIDSANGIVYIATSKGLVSFKAGGSNPFETLENAFVYPNPVRPGFNMVDQKVKIKNISENVNIKITDIEGNLVAEAQSKTNKRYTGNNLEIDGGTALWNGKNLANKVVASGVYLVMLSDLDTFETKVLKIMVVR